VINSSVATCDNPRVANRRAVIALLGLSLLAALIAALVMSRAVAIGPFGDDAGRRTASSDSSAANQRELSRSPLPRWPRARAVGFDAGIGTGEFRDAAVVPRNRPRLAGLFRGDCQFGVEAHCQEWERRATRCDRGDARACIDLGELLIMESPMQPLWGAYLLERGCELGALEVCERAETWRTWSRFGYSPPGTGADEVPVGLPEACAGGEVAACGLIQMWRARRGDLDLAAALRSCRAGFRDVCASILEATSDPSTAIAALEAGCDLPDAWMCIHLAGYYSTYCTGHDPPEACPAPNPERAAHYRALACRLDPQILPCRESP
jgi:hypothetical protein